MRKILGLVMSLLIVFSTVSTVLAEESNECLLCHGTKVFECPEMIVPRVTFVSHAWIILGLDILVSAQHVEEQESKT